MRLKWTALALTMCAPAIGHAQQSASITLRGYVPETSTIRVLDVEPVISEDLRTPVRDAFVARVVEQSNSPSGYVITVISENARRAGAALRDRRSGTSLPYQLSYGGQPIRFVNGEVRLNRLRRGKRSSQPSAHELRISTASGAQLAGGEYTDTITIAISAR